MSWLYIVHIDRYISVHITDELDAYSHGYHLVGARQVGPGRSRTGRELIARLEEFGLGGEGGARTHDPRIMSPLL